MELSPQLQATAISSPERTPVPTGQETEWARAGLYLFEKTENVMLLQVFELQTVQALVCFLYRRVAKWE
jgi:hypothetical protein